MTKTITKDDLRFNTERQRELMRVILKCFEEFAQREQSYYLIDGMSTAHVTVHAIQDFTTLRAFWPKELVKHTHQGVIYQLEDDTMRKVQNNVRSTLNQLEERNYVIRQGNENERRWLPNKGLRGVTLHQLDGDYR